MGQATLDADLRRAQFPGLHGLLRDLVKTEEVGVVLARAPAEGAKFAAHEADVREIDVAIDDIGDEVAGELRPELIRRDQQAEQILPVTVREE